MFTTFRAMKQGYRVICKDLYVLHTAFLCCHHIIGWHISNRCAFVLGVLWTGQIFNPEPHVYLFFSVELTKLRVWPQTVWFCRMSLISIQHNWKIKASSKSRFDLFGYFCFGWWKLSSSGKHKCAELIQRKRIHSTLMSSSGNFVLELQTYSVKPSY